MPAYHDPALIHFPTPYATVPMGDDISEGGLKDDPNQEMKLFLPQVNEIVFVLKNFLILILHRIINGF